MLTRTMTINYLGMGYAVVLAAGAISQAAVINVPGDAPLSVAIAIANSGDEIVLSDSGSPYLVFPGLSWTNKALTVRGLTGNRDDVVVSGANLDVVFTVNGAGSDGTVFQDLTRTAGTVRRHDAGATAKRFDQYGGQPFPLR